jgi:cell division protease FtsH
MAESNKSTSFHLWYLVVAVLAVLALQAVLHQAQQEQSIPYSEFEQRLKEGRVKDVMVLPDYIEGTLKDEAGRDQPFATVRVDPAVAAELGKYGVTYRSLVANTFLRDLLSWVVPAAVFFGLWMLLFRRIGGGQGLGGFMSVGKSKAKIYVETDTKVTFADVAGVDEAKAELQEIVGFLKDPAQYRRLGAHIPKGVLLVGPPGTGKTLLARAVAGEAGVPFFSISGSEFVEMFVGVGAARVRDLFEEARKKAPAIIFIDELDALGRARGAYPFGGGYDEKEQTLNQLLAELDGFDPQGGLVLLAATNRPEILDPALLRAGRFDRQVLVDRPDRTGRVQILNVHLRKARLAPDVDAETIAALTPGFTGADIANLVNEATLLATRRSAEAVTLEDFTQAIERIVAGLEKRSRLLNPQERKVTAYHEMGHALLALTLGGTDVVHKVSIIPRGIGSLGYTIKRPTEDRFLMTREELEIKMAVLLGGRAAEQLVFAQLSTGAADDLAKATDIARAMATRYGMVEGLGDVTYEADPHPFLGTPMPEPFGRPRAYSETTARKIDCAVRELVAGALQRATATLRQCRTVLDRGAAALLERETLGEPELKALVGEPAAEAAKAAEEAPRRRGSQSAVG